MRCCHEPACRPVGGGTSIDELLRYPITVEDTDTSFWKERADFRAQFANPDFPHPFDTSRNQIHFLGVWDTVKSLGWLDLRGRLQVSSWPFTARISNVGCAGRPD